ncbi:MAG: hypothetical protein HC865_07825 [Cyanobacteria bacterium RU_5_0]|nr:hypothetical protein [Cyanobacteria bacterium RU_5_0]
MSKQIFTRPMITKVIILYAIVATIGALFPFRNADLTSQPTAILTMLRRELES